MRRNFWQEWEDVGRFYLVGWLVGVLLQEWGGWVRRSCSGTEQASPSPQLSTGLKDRRPRTNGADTF